MLQEPLREKVRCSLSGQLVPLYQKRMSQSTPSYRSLSDSVRRPLFGLSGLFRLSGFLVERN
jgi:hypothetical protein